MCHAVVPSEMGHGTWEMAVEALVDRLSQTREAAPLRLRDGRLDSRMGNTARRTQGPTTRIRTRPLGAFEVDARLEGSH